MIQLPSRGRLKREVKRYHLAYRRRFRAFTPEDLGRFLYRLGVNRGDCLLVHSSLEPFAAFTGKPLDIIRVLQQAVGREGLLAMPTSPFSFTAVDWAQQGQVFDVRRTPSQVGLLTEIFRRLPDVRRSVHPTHAVAAWGANVEQFLRGHHAAVTPCGAGSPFAKLAERDGKILLLGTGKHHPLTFYHGVEEEIEALLPFSPFTRETFLLISIDGAGKPVKTRTRLFDPDISKRRNMQKLAAYLKAEGAWRQERLNELEASLCRARDVACMARTMAERGEFCYDT